MSATTKPVNQPPSGFVEVISADTEKPLLINVRDICCVHFDRQAGWPGATEVHHFTEDACLHTVVYDEAPDLLRRVADAYQDAFDADQEAWLATANPSEWADF